jgi:hypothetical protein
VASSESETTVQTGQRGATKPNPRDTTGMTFYRQQQAQTAKLKSRQTVEESRTAGFWEGYDQGFDDGVEAVLSQLRDAGLIDDEDQGDEA